MYTFILEDLPGNPILPVYLTHVSPFLQFFDTSMPAIVPDARVKSMVMILSKNGRPLNDLNLIKSVTGKDLKHLSLCKLMVNNENEADDSPYVCYIFIIIENVSLVL